MTDYLDIFLQNLHTEINSIIEDLETIRELSEYYTSCNLESIVENSIDNLENMTADIEELRGEIDDERANNARI